MKKLIASLFATILLAGLMAAFTSTPVSAAPPYPGTIPTFCSASAANSPRPGTRPRAKFRATTNGNGVARGVVKFTYRKNGDVFASYQRRYEGNGREVYNFRPIRFKGVFNVRVRFNTQPRNSAYQNCSASFKQRVRSRR